MLSMTARTRLRRKRERASFDRDVLHGILDEALVCHVGFVADHGPVVLPMTYARLGDLLYLHGAAGNDMLGHLAGGAPACVTVTLLDGLVFARSAFKHSMNYRSVVLFGVLTRVAVPDEMRAASAALLDHLAPGRAADARPPSDEELRATMILRMVVREGSIKIRNGGPLDEPTDLSLPIWAGELPLTTTAAAPVTDISAAHATPPSYVTHHALYR